MNDGDQDDAWDDDDGTRRPQERYMDVNPDQEYLHRLRLRDEKKAEGRANRRREVWSPLFVGISGGFVLWLLNLFGQQVIAWFLSHIR